MPQKTLYDHHASLDISGGWQGVLHTSMIPTMAPIKAAKEIPAQNLIHAQHTCQHMKSTPVKNLIHAQHTCQHMKSTPAQSLIHAQHTCQHMKITPEQK